MLFNRYDSNLLGQFKLAIENSDLSERIKSNL